MTTCLHVKVKATALDLHCMGISQTEAKALLSGRAFLVKRKVKADKGKWRFLLEHPDNRSTLWIYEDFTEPV